MQAGEERSRGRLKREDAGGGKKWQETKRDDAGQLEIMAWKIICISNN